METNPAGYVSVGATAVSGTVRTASWIEFAGPLSGQTFTGNRFWDRVAVLSGRVYEGEVGDESQPLEGVTVSLYCAGGPYPDPGTFVVSTTTSAEGWYGLEAPDVCEYYHVRETDLPGYTSAGATTVSGTVRTNNWIEYVIPLEGQTLTGNKFWDRPPPETVNCTSCSDCSAKLNGIAGNGNGIRISGSTGAELSRNLVCPNSAVDILAQGGANNTGYDNACDTPTGWNDVGYTGCAFRCAAQPSLYLPLILRNRP